MTTITGETVFRLGAQYDSQTTDVIFRVYSQNATRVELCLFLQPRGEDELERWPMMQEMDGTWTATIDWLEMLAKGFRECIYYGYRAWGPNWDYDPAWNKGTEIGFRTDVDEMGNRFNPNKILLDPYAREISHDPEQRLSFIDPNECREEYYSGPGFRHIDTAMIAPKSIFVPEPVRAFTGTKPLRRLKDDVIYEVNVRGFTRQDVSIPAEFQGTYKGAGLKADYLKNLGVTAVEFLPVHHFASEQNDDGDPRGDNYWGYMTLGYFAPNRRYSSDKSAGGPTREFKEMVKMFHDAGIKVFLDVVYNHTGEGLLRRNSETAESRGNDALQYPDQACLLSFRGLDNASYYTLRSNLALDGKRNQRYQDNSGCGGSLNVSNQVVRDFIVESLQYWSDDMGVDGFRFDLAPVLGNALREGGFSFDRSDSENVLNRIVRELPARDPAMLVGVDLIAEPWAVGDGTYQLGKFPDDWSEWNDKYRDVLRRAENKLSMDVVTPAEIANAIAGSDKYFHQNSPRERPQPSSSINYIVSHDGYTLRDLYSYTGDGYSWDHGGNRAAQRQAVRNAFALLMVSAGTPMITGGDELFRTIGGRTNAVAVDDASVHLNWGDFTRYTLALAENDRAILEYSRANDDIRTFEFARNMIQFRMKYPALRPASYFTGADGAGTGLKDVTWLRSDGGEMTDGDWGDAENQFLGFRINNQNQMGDTGVASIFVAYSWGDTVMDIGLPWNLPQKRWYRVADTAEWMEHVGNFEDAQTMLENSYEMHGRSVLVLVEK